MDKVTLDSGLELEVDVEILDDWDFFELLREVDKGNTGAIVDIIPIALGDEQFQKLKAHLKNEKGKVKASDMVGAFYEFFEKIKQLKNSSSSAA